MEISTLYLILAVMVAASLTLTVVTIVMMRRAPTGDAQSESRPESNVATGIAIGAGGGVALGLVFDNLAIGIAIGAAVGIAIGSALDASNNSNRPSSVRDRRWLFASGVGALLLAGIVFLLLVTSGW
jgi:uncharacterized membrane protein